MPTAAVREWRAWFGIALWALLLVLAGTWVTRTLQVDSDLRLFLPEPGTPEERILLEELGEGPGTRMLLVAISGSTVGRLAAASEQVAASLRSSPLFSRVENGTLMPAPELQELMLRYRYLLSPRAAGCACDSASLQRELQARLLELGSPAGAVAQDLLLRDPSGELQAILESWLPAAEPELVDGVWFSRDQTQALLLLQTAAAGFDADQQRLALAALREALHSADPRGELRLTTTGPGAFTVLLEQSVRKDIALLGSLAGAGSILFLLLVLRSLRHTCLGVLTLATTGLVAILGVNWAFPSVHGITLAFGFTLLGVAMDYPVHLMLHLEKRDPPRATLAHVWPTLRLSIITTCIAYLALVTTGFTGLMQLGTFTVCGLIATATIIRWILPRCLANESARTPPAWLETVDRLPRLPLLAAIVLVVAVVALSASTRPLWSNELAALTPVPQDLQDLDARFRSELGAPDLRYIIAIRATDREAALQRDESLRADMEGLVRDGVIGGFDAPSRLLPSIARQRQTQRGLPDEAELRARLNEALFESPFREDAFEPFIADLTASRELQPLTPDDLRGTLLADRLDAVLLQRPAEALALVTLNNVQDTARLESWTAAAGPEVLLLDLTTIAEQLVERYRSHALLALALALVVIAALLLAQLRWRTALAVLLPVMATLAATVAILNLAATPLTLFHIVALLLVGGLSFDYGLFFNRAEATRVRELRTRHSVMVCWVSTSGAFALLTLSQMPVLRAIGSTVSLGVTLGFLIALLTRRTGPLEGAVHAG